MSRRPKPRWYASRGAWYIILRGKQIKLAMGHKNEEQAYQAYERLMLVEKGPANIAHIAELLKVRRSKTPADFDVAARAEAFAEAMVEIFREMFPAFVVDDLLLRPRESLCFCDAVRQRTGYHDLPDDIILQGVRSGAAAARGRRQSRRSRKDRPGDRPRS